MPSEKPKSSTIEKPTSPVDIERGIEDIKLLKEQFEVALTEGRKTKDLSHAKKLKEEIEAKLAEIEGAGAVNDKEKLEDRVKAREKFLSDTYKTGGIPKARIAEAEKMEDRAASIRPQDIDWKEYRIDVDATKFGEYTVNPSTSSLTRADLELREKEGKIKLLDLKEFVGKPLAEVAEYLVKTYGAEQLPGIELLQDMVENPGTASAALKDSKNHFFFGSVLRHSDGVWSVPYACWIGGGFSHYADWLGGNWRSDFRVVILDK